MILLNLKIPWELKSDHLKSGLFEGKISNDLFSNGRALTIAIVPTIPGHFCPDFKWFLTKWRPFVWISNGWGSGFQVPFQIQASFGPFKIQTRLDFRYPL